MICYTVLVQNKTGEQANGYFWPCGHIDIIGLIYDNTEGRCVCRDTEIVYGGRCVSSHQGWLNCKYIFLSYHILFRKGLESTDLYSDAYLAQHKQ